MAKTVTPHRKFINDLGGPTALASALAPDHSIDAVKQWGQPGREIPWKARERVKRLARRKRVPLPANFMDGGAA